MEISAATVPVSLLGHTSRDGRQTQRSRPGVPDRADQSVLTSPPCMVWRVIGNHVPRREFISMPGGAVAASPDRCVRRMSKRVRYELTGAKSATGREKQPENSRRFC